MTHRQPEKPTTHWVVIYSAIFFLLGAVAKAVRYTVNCPFKSPLRVIGPKSGYRLPQIKEPPRPPPPLSRPSTCKQKIHPVISSSGYDLHLRAPPPPPPPVIGPSPCKQKKNKSNYYPPDILPYNFSKYTEMNSIYYDDLSLN